MKVALYLLLMSYIAACSTDETLVHGLPEDTEDASADSASRSDSSGEPDAADTVAPADTVADVTADGESLPDTLVNDTNDAFELGDTLVEPPDTLDAADANASADTVAPPVTIAFRPYRSYTTSGPSNAVRVADIDKDGDLDVLVPIYGSVARLDVFTNDGSGSLTHHGPYAAVTGGIDVGVADMNGDGLLDAVVVGYSGVGVLFGNGSGGFVSPKITSAPADTVLTGVIARDFDGDTVPDAVVGLSGSPQRVLFYRGHGDGFFDAPVATYGPSQSGIAAFDMDGDGNLDIVTSDVSAAHQGIATFVGDGHGHFVAPSVTPIADGLYGVIGGDFDGDGHIDIASAAYDSDKVWTLLGDGRGAFRSTHANIVGDGAEFPSVGDVDGDGVLDIVSVGNLSNTVVVLRGRGDGTFGFGASVTIPVMHSAYSAVADLNGDGKAEIIVGNDGLGVFLNTTD